MHHWFCDERSPVFLAPRRRVVGSFVVMVNLPQLLALLSFQLRACVAGTAHGELNCCVNVLEMVLL